MSLPANVGFGRVTGRLIRAILDGPIDPDTEPNGVPIEGAKVTFTASVNHVVNRTATPPVSIFIDPVTVVTNSDGILVSPDGTVGVTLVASDGADLDTSGWTYKVTMTAPSISALSWSITVPEGSVQDLSTAIPVSANPGSAVVEWQQLRDEALGYRDGAVAAETEATKQAGIATGAASNAATSESNAAISAGEAESSASAAAGSANAANSSATAASDSATAAATSASQAAGSAADAEAAAEVATTKAGIASSAATAASDSAGAAAGSASDAAGSATTASEQAGIAVQAALDATTAAANALPEWDATAGEYTPASIAAWIKRQRDGKLYGVSIPIGLSVECTKTGANAGIANPTPGVIGTPAVDPYTGRGPFFTATVNATVDANGIPHVTAFEGDANFSRTTKDTWVLAPVLFWRWDGSDAAASVLTITDVSRPGFGPQPKAKLPTGKLRPYMLYAKYALSIDSTGTARSVSGAKIQNRNVSHDSLITQTKTATTGYAGKSFADDWYVKAMFLLKYATKNSQSVMYGCANYYFQFPVTVAENGVKRVIVATTLAAKIAVGSRLMYGTATASPDRNASTSYNVFDGLKVLSKETYNATNTVINLESSTAFNTTVGTYVSTSPWGTGACDTVEGDGSPTSNTARLEPFVLQGIEMMLGMSEVLGDVILQSAGSGWQIYTNPDSKNEAISVTADYVASGKYSPSGAADGAQYPVAPSVANGMLFGEGNSGSTTTGLCDHVWANATTVTGTRGWLSGGTLVVGDITGLWYVHAGNSLTNTNWGFGSRLSAIGRAS